MPNIGMVFAGMAAAQGTYVCERAVASAPENGLIRDSRGLARAPMGHFTGASEDFHFYLQWAQRSEISSHGLEASKREHWIENSARGNSMPKQSWMDCTRSMGGNDDLLHRLRMEHFAEMEV